MIGFPGSSSKWTGFDLNAHPLFPSLSPSIVITPSGSLPSSLLDMDAAHHRHWPGVLKVIAGCHISLFQMPLPEDAVQLGGSMSLHGNHMTLACFHGPNFRSKSWALFHLEEPNIAFWTEAQKILEDGKAFKRQRGGGVCGLKQVPKIPLTSTYFLSNQAPLMTPPISCRRWIFIWVTTPW